MKKLVTQPHIIFSTENPKYADKAVENIPHLQAIHQLKNVGGGQVYSIDGSYGNPEKSIFISNPSPEQKELVRRMAFKTGQDSHIESTGSEHQMLHHHGEDAGKIKRGQGTTFHESKPNDFYSKMPDGTYFTHNFNDEFEKSEKESVSLQKMSRPRLIFPNFPKVTTRPDQEVQPVESTRQRDIYSRKAINPIVQNMTPVDFGLNPDRPEYSQRLSQRKEARNRYKQSQIDSVSRALDNKYLGVNIDTPQGPKSATIAGKRLGSQIGLNTDYQQKLKEHSEKRNQMVRDYNQKYKDWIAGYNEKSKQFAPGSPELRQFQDEWAVQKPEKPKLPRKPAKRKDSVDLKSLSQEDYAKYGRVQDSILEHEGFHHTLDQIAHKYGKDAAKQALRHVVNAHDMDALKAVGRFISDNYSYKPNDEHFDEEVIAHSRDLLVNPRKRKLFEEYHGDKAKDYLSKLKAGHERAAKVARQLKPEDVGVSDQKLAASEKIPGGLAEGKTNKDFPKLKIAQGRKVEMEHTNDPKVAEEIARDHLTEDKNYYDKLKTIEAKKSEPLMKPYRSDAQRRWAHTPAGTKALGGKEAVKEWDKESKGKKLPEKIEKGARGDWQKEGYKLEHSHNPDINQHRILVHTPNKSEVAAHFIFEQVGNEWMPTSASVKKEHQRKGIASAAYKLFEEKTGNKLVPHKDRFGQDKRSDDAKKLWEARMNKGTKRDMADALSFIQYHTSPDFAQDDSPKSFNQANTKIKKDFLKLPKKTVSLNVDLAHKNLSPVDNNRVPTEKQMKNPIIVGKFKTGEHVILDGNHRLLHAKKLGLKNIKATLVHLPDDYNSLLGLEGGVGKLQKNQSNQLANVKINPEHGKMIADAYHNMKHDPNHPEVKAAYGALIDETKKQYQDMLNQGFKFTPRKSIKHPDPYKNSKDLHNDIKQNKHIHFFPTRLGFGSKDETPKDHPMLQPTEFKDSEGYPMLANDLFRVVHDFRGHNLGGETNFGQKGEHLAYLQHKKDYSPLAQKALASETMGQNQWVHHGPFGAHNKANPKDTVYADQKAGLLPEYIINGKWHGEQ